jgi:hypothetical protein
MEDGCLLILRLLLECSPISLQSFGIYNSLVEIFDVPVPMAFVSDAVSCKSSLLMQRRREWNKSENFTELVSQAGICSWRGELLDSTRGAHVVGFIAVRYFRGLFWDHFRARPRVEPLTVPLPIPLPALGTPLPRPP